MQLSGHIKLLEIDFVQFQMNCNCLSLLIKIMALFLQKPVGPIHAIYLQIQLKGEMQFQIAIFTK